MVATKKKVVKKLVRSRNERVIGGVAGGLAEYFKLDPILVRVFFVAAAFFNGFGVLSYFILWLLLPKKTNKGGITEETMKDNLEEMKVKARELTGEVQKISSEDRGRSRNLIGWAFLIFGVILLLRNLGILRSVVWGPLVVIVLGLLFLLR
ncbi:PspC domain-containing protein [Patescibacteria group bacterium]|nr:PspC domain-containing protein [Patescibacteria group bacterium]